jgi:ABC-type dipeptide/oligopeptide/nickel transport system permease component
MLWNSISNVLENTEIIEMWIKRIWNVLCLAPLSAIFQLYRGDQFGGGGSRREPQTLGKQLVSFITCGSQLSAPIFWARTHAVLVIGLYDGLLPLSFNIV